MSTPLTILAAPRIGRGQFQWLLESYRSPVAPRAQHCYDIICRYGIDPAIAAAWFAKESVFGTRGITVQTRNWGNVREPFNPKRASGRHPRNFAIFPTWEISLDDWCERMVVRYVQRGLDTVEKALPVYAPVSDGNNTNLYIDQVHDWIDRWMADDDATRLYRVDVWRANVRKTPSTADKVITKLIGEEVFAGREVQGAAVDGNALWIERAAGGYVHSGILRSM